MAVLTAVASLTVVVPLYRGRRSIQSVGAAEVAIYRDQLGEVDRDLARGLIADPEATAARTEIARRLIHANDDDRQAATPALGRRRISTIAALTVLPALALGLYLYEGSPFLPDEPLSARLAAPIDKQDVATLVARVEAHLAANPEDGHGWEVLGPIYMRVGRYDDAIRAFSNAIRILGSSANLEADLGEAIVRNNKGMVTADAQAAFERANKLDEKAVRPRFYLALGLSQEGKKDAAITAWKSLLQGAPEGAAWVAIARRALASLEGKEGGGDSATAATAPGPSAADVQAASQMTPEQRLTMINGMVAQLAQKLESDPGDAEGWARLIRSYMVLKRTDDARAALDKAHTALAGDSAKLAVVDDAARGLGLMK